MSKKQTVENGVYFVKYTEEGCSKQPGFLAAVSGDEYMPLTGMDIGKTFDVGNAAKPTFTPAKITEFQTMMKVKVEDL